VLKQDVSAKPSSGSLLDQRMWESSGTRGEGTLTRPPGGPSVGVSTPTSSTTVPA